MAFKENGDIILYDEDMKSIDIFQIQKEQFNFNPNFPNLAYYNKKYQSLGVHFMISTNSITGISYVRHLSIQLNKKLSIWLTTDSNY